MDRALADFAERNFAAAAKNAGFAVSWAQTKRTAAEELVTRAIYAAIAAKVHDSI